jgi:hypothetical protein
VEICAGILSLAVFGVAGAPLSLEPVGAFGVGLWKNIRKGWRYSRAFLDLRWGMGRGSNFGMMWCRDTVLKETFPVLFSIAHANLYCD